MGQIGPVAIPPLSAELEREGTDAYRIATAFADMGGAAVPALVQHLSSQRADARYCAARTLGRIGPPDALPAVEVLEGLLSDEEEYVRNTAAEALEALGASPVEAPSA